MSWPWIEDRGPTDQGWEGEKRRVCDGSLWKKGAAIGEEEMSGV